MEIILIGLATNFLTRVSKKLNLSWTYMAIILSVVSWTIYYLATKYYVVERKEFITFLSGIYATSQIVFQLIKKLWILDNIKGL